METSGRGRRIALWAVLVLGVVVLGVALAVTIPILSHQSAGGSGQNVPQGVVAEASAEGADGRTRTISAELPGGAEADLAQLAPGEKIVVRGEGFDASIGMYVAFCEIPDAGERPSPCLGDIPTDGETVDAAEQGALSSAWVTDDWAWRAFATDRWADAASGSFEVELTVPDPVGEGIDCRETRCAIATRADHTAGSDRVQDMLLPVAFTD